MAAPVAGRSHGLQRVCKTEQQPIPRCMYIAQNVDSQLSPSKRSSDRGRRCATGREASLADGSPLDRDALRAGHPAQTIGRAPGSARHTHRARRSTIEPPWSQPPWSPQGRSPPPATEPGLGQSGRDTRSECRGAFGHAAALATSDQHNSGCASADVGLLVVHSGTTVQRRPREHHLAMERVRTDDRRVDT